MLAQLHAEIESLKVRLKASHLQTQSILEIDQSIRMDKTKNAALQKQPDLWEIKFLELEFTNVLDMRGQIDRKIRNLDFATRQANHEIVRQDAAAIPKVPTNTPLIRSFAIAEVTAFLIITAIMLACRITTNALSNGTRAQPTAEASIL